MKNFRAILFAILLVGLIGFWPNDAQSRQYFDATVRFNPISGTLWHYFTTVLLIGNEIQMGQRDQVGGLIWTIYDEEVTSSGNGLVGVHLRFNVYEALDLSIASAYEDPGGGALRPPDYSAPAPVDIGYTLWDRDMSDPGHAEPQQSVGGGGGGSAGGGSGGGDEELLGEGEFQLTPIMESNINYIMSESGRMLDISGLDLVGDIVDPSRSINVRQVFQTTHPIVLPDYQVHLNESWRAPYSWTIPFVGETMEIPLIYTLADIRTTYRFRVAAIDFSGILQFDVDVSDENLTERKESNIKGDIVLQGRAYIDLDRGVMVALTDLPALGTSYFVDGERRGNESYSNDLGLPWSLNPGFYVTLNFERRDLYTPLGNVVDPRQEVVWKIQELSWFTTTVVE